MSGVGPVGVAVGADVVAQVPDEGALVPIRRAAAPAVLCIVGVLELRERLGRVLDPEVGDARTPAQLAVTSEVRDQGVVGVEGELAGSLQLGHQDRPLVREPLQLAVAVELVAEEVAEHQQARMKAGRDAGEPGLVELEEALVAGLLEQGRGHAPVHVGARPVVDRPAPGRLQDPGDHARRGRLAVGRADDDRAAIEARGEALDRVRSHSHQHAPGQRRAAAAPAGTTEATDGPRDGALGGEQGAHGASRLGGLSRRGSRQAGGPAKGPGGAITFRARGSTVSFAGRSVRCSPSA